MLSLLLNKVLNGSDLTEREISEALGRIMDKSRGEILPAAFLTALRMKGETLPELIGAARFLRSHARSLECPNRELLDTCGTGGDGSSSFNISTTAAFVASGAGVRVAKHGNSGISSRCGSADLLAALGTNLKEFFASEDDDEKVVYAKDEFIEKQGAGYTLDWLVPNAQKNVMEPVLISLQSESSTEDDFPHEGEEFGYVLEGEIKIVLGKKAYKCKKGQSFYFSSNKVHKIVNEKSRKAVFIWVSSPPNF